MRRLSGTLGAAQHAQDSLPHRARRAFAEEARQLAWAAGISEERAEVELERFEARREAERQRGA